MTQAYSYIRFSHPSQAEGGSLKRQLDLSRNYCQRNNLTLDESLNLHDLGVSAYRGDNANQGHLAAFLEAIHSGKVKPGSVLIVESVDRISRQGIDEGYDLLKRILKSGVRIATLSPERDYGPESVKGLTKGALELLIILERAHEESEIKSHRRKHGWKLARDKARSGGGPMMKTCPSWLEVAPEGFQVKKEAAATVKRIFDMAIDGLGVYRITERLVKDRVPPIGNSGRWVKAYTYRILTNPAAMGSYQPQRQEGKKVVPDGEPIAKYYPAVVSEKTWNEAQLAIRRRSNGQGAGRKGSNETNLFSGLLFDGVSGQRLNIVHALGRKIKGQDRRVYRYLTPTKESGIPGGEQIDYEVFESAILSRLEELKPADVTPRKEHHDDSEIDRLNGRLQDIDSRLGRAKQRAKTAADFDTFLDLIQELQSDRKQVAAQLTELEQQNESQPVKELQQAQSLLGLLKNTPADQLEDVRRRLKNKICQLITSIHVVIVRHGRKCLAEVQVFFRGSNRRRDSLIQHVPGNRYASGFWKCRTWIGNELAQLGLDTEDLRDVDQAGMVQGYLQSLTPDQIQSIFTPGLLNAQYRARKPQ